MILRTCRKRTHYIHLIYITKFNRFHSSYIFSRESLSLLRKYHPLHVDDEPTIGKIVRALYNEEPQQLDNIGFIYYINTSYFILSLSLVDMCAICAFILSDAYLRQRQGNQTHGSNGIFLLYFLRCMLLWRTFIF